MLGEGGRGLRGGWRGLGEGGRGLRGGWRGLREGGRGLRGGCRGWERVERGLRGGWRGWEKVQTTYLRHTKLSFGNGCVRLRAGYWRGHDRFQITGYRFSSTKALAHFAVGHTAACSLSPLSGSAQFTTPFHGTHPELDASSAHRNLMKYVLSRVSSFVHSKQGSTVKSTSTATVGHRCLPPSPTG